MSKEYALGAFFGRDKHELVSQIPHAAARGMQVSEAGPGLAVLTLDYRDEFVGDPVRCEASPSRRVMNPSRPSAKRIREAPAAHPRQLAKALTVAPKLIASSMPLPT